MSLFGTLNTAVSGLAAQASALSTIGDNIANSNTTGYKGADTEFETLLGNQATSYYESGGVQTRVRYAITDQGTINATSSTTDLAISGNGFFVVQDSSGSSALTRAGSFLPDSTGNLVNTAGYTLMGYKVANGTTSATLSAVNLNSPGLAASPSSAATMAANLNSTATAVTGTLPSANSASSTYTSKTSLVAYDNLGNAVTMDIYFTKTAANSWDVDVYNAAGATNGGFPYAAGNSLGSGSLTFDPTTGSLDSSSATSVSVAIPNGNSALAIDLSKTTQLASTFSAGTPTIDGSSPASVKSYTIGNDGTVAAVYSNGITKNMYQIPLATVASPDNLTSISGNVYKANTQSGAMTVGTAGSGNLGKVDSSSLESSTVDIATELTRMITTQRSYEANSKVITTSSDLLSVITNLK